MFRPVLCSPILHAAIVAAGIVSGPHAAHAENRLALVIGQSAYRAVTPLPNPANDAKAMTQLLGDAGFDVVAAPDLSQNELREKIGEFAARIAAKGADTVALVFYAGHGMQIDGENFLVPVDVDPKREADIPLQAVRLNDVLNTLNSVPSKTRIILLDACRNNPFPEISKTAGHGLAIVDAKVGAAGTFVSYSTSPGAEAEDGTGSDSPYTTALLKTAREPGLSIEEAFKRVRVSVNQATEGRQTPWDSSSLTTGFSFFGQQGDAGSKPAAKRTVDDWRRELHDKQPDAANELIVSDGSVEAYEAFVGLFAQPPFGPQARQWLDLQRRMTAWNNAVISNTGAAYHEFLVQYPDSDLTATARKLEERMRNRPIDAALAAANDAVAAPQNPAVPTNVALTCPCSAPPPSPLLQKVDLPPVKRVEPEPPKRLVSKPPRHGRRAPPDEEVVVVHRPPPVYYEPAPAPVIPGGIGIGIGIGRFGGGHGRGGNYGRD